MLYGSHAYGSIEYGGSYGGTVAVDHTLSLSDSMSIADALIKAMGLSKSDSM